LLSGGRHATRKIKRAQILLAANDGVSDEVIAATLKVSGSTIYQIDGAVAAIFAVVALKLARLGGNEIVGRYKQNRAAYAVALTTDTSALTAIVNDYGFDQVFARQVEGLGQRGDVLPALSTSGRSPNILAALRGALRALCDHLLVCLPTIRRSFSKSISPLRTPSVTRSNRR
jgi:hypothetical protein